MHEVERTPPSEQGLAYVRALAAAHREADVAEEATQRIAPLKRALQRPAPPSFGDGELLRLELAARLCETYLELGRPAQALETLGPMLQVERSLPLDRASAHALVIFGDAARAAGDDALAAGSYARAVQVMGLLREQLMVEAGLELEGPAKEVTK